MIDQLIQIGQELEPQLREVFNEKFGDKVLGVAIDVDPYWEIAELMNLYFLRDLRYFFRPPGDLEWTHGNDEYRARIRTLRIIENLPADFNYRPGNWLDYCKSMGYPYDANPIRIQVSLKYGIHSNEQTELPATFRENYPVIYETKRKQAKLIKLTLSGFIKRAINILRGRRSALAPEVFNQNGRESGTIGGILAGASSRKLYLLTCGHVLGDKGSIAYGANGLQQRIGKVVHFKMPPTSSSPNVCSNFTHPKERSVDVSVVELECPPGEIYGIDKLAVPRGISSVKDIRIGDPVSFLGKTSGRVHAKMGPLTLWYAFEHEGVQRCFGNVFQLKPVLKQYVNEPIARPGDSGSWVIGDFGVIPNLYGMITAEEDGTAYGCFAEFMIDSARQGLGESLKCVD